MIFSTLFSEILPPEPILVKTPRQSLLSARWTFPPATDAPSHTLPPNVSIIVSEGVSPRWTTIYRGTVATTGHDTTTLEEVLRMWLLEYLLLNKIPPIPVVRLGFVLLPWPNKDPD
jgi:WD repeat-containing protein 48